MSYLDDMFGLEGQVVVITGGSGAIASALADGFLKAGAKVALWGRGKSRSMDEAALAAGEKAGGPERCRGYKVDTNSREETEAALQATLADFGSVDVLVNGVGGNRGKCPLLEQDVELFREVMDLNLVAGLLIPLQVFGLHWKEAGTGGTIINLASMASHMPLSGVWAYDAAKAAVLNLTYGAAKELAPLNIRVNALTPGFFVGEQNRALLYTPEGELTPRARSIIDHTPYGRFGDTSELIGATLFLASRKAAGFVTGVSLPVDGGYLIDNV